MVVAKCLLGTESIKEHHTGKCQDIKAKVSHRDRLEFCESVGLLFYANSIIFTIFTLLAPPS